MPISWTALPTLQRVTFFDPTNTSNSWTPLNNPIMQDNKPDTLRKYTETTNGTSVILGGNEGPPKELTLTWNTMDGNDLENLLPFQAIAPLVYVDNNDQGYLGVLVFDDIQQLSDRTMLVYKVQASFYVIAPYNGLHTSLSQVTAPALTVTAVGSGGSIPTGTTLYLWSTVFTPWGESVTSTDYSATTSANNSKITVTWTAPSNSYYRKTRLYWNTSNTPSTATMLTEAMAGQSASFTIVGPYAEYSLVTPPTYGTAFYGQFSGTRFLQTI